MTKIKLARTVCFHSFSVFFFISLFGQVAKLDTASMIVHSSATLLPTLFVVSVVMPAIWQEIAQTDREAQIGVMMIVVDLEAELRVERSGRVMQLIGSMR